MEFCFGQVVRNVMWCVKLYEVYLRPARAVRLRVGTCRRALRQENYQNMVMSKKKRGPYSASRMSANLTLPGELR